MPNAQERPSLTKNLLQRYSEQWAGGAYNVKERLKAPGSRPVYGDRMPITDASGQGVSLADTKWTNKDFEVESKVTEFKDTSEGETTLVNSKELSDYIKGFSKTRYGDSTFLRGTGRRLR